MKKQKIDDFIQGGDWGLVFRLWLCDLICSDLGHFAVFLLHNRYDTCGLNSVWLEVSQWNCLISRYL